MVWKDNVSEIGHVRILPLENLQVATDNSTLSNFQPRIANIAPLLDKSLIISGVGAGIIGIILISLLSKRLFRSVQHLTIAAKRISDGDFSQRISETGKDEIGELSKTFNMMADRLENTNIHRKNLMADIAHEIRTPVSNIQGYIEAVKEMHLLVRNELIIDERAQDKFKNIFLPGYPLREHTGYVSPYFMRKYKQIFQ